MIFILKNKIELITFKINTGTQLLLLFLIDIFTVISSYYRVAKKKVTEELLLLTLFILYLLWVWTQPVNLKVEDQNNFFGPFFGLPCSFATAIFTVKQYALISWAITVSLYYRLIRIYLFGHITICSTVSPY